MAYTKVFPQIAANLPQICLIGSRFAATFNGVQSNIAARRRYSQQREKKTPPHVTLKVLRIALGKTLDEVSGRVFEITGDRPTKGALSAIENGHRGVSAELLSALEQAYGLEPGSITTTYRPRVTPHLAEEVSA